MWRTQNSDFSICKMGRTIAILAVSVSQDDDWMRSLANSQTMLPVWNQDQELYKLKNNYMPIGSDRLTGSDLQSPVLGIFPRPWPCWACPPVIGFTCTQFDPLLPVWNILLVLPSACYVNSDAMSCNINSGAWSRSIYCSLAWLNVSDLLP